MTRVFLDANALFSAAWNESSGISRLWEMENVRLVTSPYALAEAQRNIRTKRPDAAPRPAKLASEVETSALSTDLSEDFSLPEKDRPILASAVGSDCSILLTGDVTHFGHLIGTEAAGVRVLTVSMFLRDAQLSQLSRDEAEYQ